MTMPVPERDTRIDVLRALALLTIFVDHVPGTVFENLTYKNLGFSDAAEAFVLISGISVALAYGSKFKPGGRLLSTLKMWRRAGVLYVAHIVTTMVVIAMFCAAAAFIHRPDLLKMINIEPLLKHPPEVLLGIVTLGHQLGYNNILPVYAALLLAAPVFVLFVSYRPVVALTVSGLLWLIAGIWQIAPPNYPEPGLWFLNPLSWQFLFNIGLAVMLHVRRGGTIPVNRWLVGAAGAYVLTALVWVHSPLWGQITWFDLPVVIGGFDKTFLSLPRLLHILSVSYLIVALPAVSNFFRTRPDNPLAILGKRSLPVFIAGTLIAMVAQVLKLINPGGFAYDSLLIAAGIAMQFALALYLEWLSGLGPARAKPARDEPGRASFGVRPVPARVGGY
ncbi:OpgC family protein [Mesorhizobium sp. B1-1-8]|uniref:OpgC family protein n=1 Tax=Mesorhizobium sp. B1-1-8 TaxID=2589976 RepID=UPI00112A236E|nr:OpgC family protein [Mesorhizobium sp. B1-1-8]UCI05988.1 OpgC family protein [Mesorhizobium sp. B1-1-8]